ncbi:MAG: hypothetical protein K9M45_02915, partial [Kiritimatiellales bacterium]|nr:hypothetical protein [Kiritimatiellales bacterium]
NRLWPLSRGMNYLPIPRNGLPEMDCSYGFRVDYVEFVGGPQKASGGGGVYSSALRLEHFGDKVLFSDIFRGSDDKTLTVSHWKGQTPWFQLGWGDGHVGRYTVNDATVYNYIRATPGTGGATTIFRAFDADGN